MFRCQQLLTPQAKSDGLSTGATVQKSRYYSLHGLTALILAVSTYTY